MAQTIFELIESFFVYVVEVPIVLAVILVFVYIMYSLNLFRKE